MNKEITIILCRPQLGENIGACARAMKNFSISDLRIVAPRDGWPSEQALSVSAGASDIIESAKVYTELKDAIEGIEYLYATTATKRYLNKNHILSKELQSSIALGCKVGILFGRENWGLSNEEISYANDIITIDTDPNFSSLNIAQSVLVVCYELFKAIERPDLHNTQEIATKNEIEYFYDHLFQVLEAKNFFKIPEKKSRMQMNIRNIFARIDKLSKSEIQTLRGIVSVIK